MLKDKQNLLKVAVGALILTGVFVGMYLGANNFAFVAATDDQNVVYLPTEANDDPIEIEIIENEWFLELAELESMPHIVTNGWSSTQVNQVILLDLTTGEPMAIYEFGEYEAVEQVWDLGNGYYAAWVGDEDLWNRSSRLGIDLPDDFEFSWGDELERNFRIVIFDENLNPIDTLPYSEKMHSVIFFNRHIRFENGELFVYDFAPYGQDITWHFQRVNLHTGEITVLFETQNHISTHGFIGDNQFLVTDWLYPNGIKYGIFDLETGDITFSEQQQVFDFGNFVLTGSNLVMSEHQWGWRSGPELTNQIMILDLEDLSREMIQLAEGDSVWARPSYDGNHIVTINESESVFRKYDMDGNVIARANIVLPFDFDNYHFEIFPITEQVYAIHIHTPLLDGGRHIQMVTLDGYNHVITPTNQQVTDPFGTIEFMRLRTPEAHHLSEEEAREIGIQWIYEEFGVKVDTAALGHSFWLSFEHEDLDIVNRSFWVGSFRIEGMFGDALSAFDFVIDGITGERIAIADAMLPFDPISTIITVGDMKITVLDYSLAPNVWNPSSHIEQQTYHLSAEEAALLIAESIYAEFGINLDGHRMHMHLGLYFEGVVGWGTNINRPDERYTAGFQLMFIASVDATTGERLNISDTRNMAGQGVNQFVENKELTLNDIRLAVEVTYSGYLQSSQLSLEEMAQISADMIYEAFGVSLDGLFLKMNFWGEHWTITVKSAENGSYMFQFFLNAETGDFVSGESITDLRGQ